MWSKADMFGTVLKRIPAYLFTEFSAPLHLLLPVEVKVAPADETLGLFIMCCPEISNVFYVKLLTSASISGKTEGSGVKVSVIKFNITELIKLKEEKVRNVLVQPIDI